MADAKTGSYRSAITGRYAAKKSSSKAAGKTSDGVTIFAPKSGGKHFTLREARDAVAAARKGKA